MMFISTLLIDTGTNPDRPRPARSWLQNMYRVHQRLCMAFPSKEREGKDEDFLDPFKPEDFGGGQVHIDRRTGNGFLFRIDVQLGGTVVILVSSAIRPNWDYAFHNAGHFLAAPPQIKEYNPSFKKGQFFKFRLTANPTRRCTKNSKDSNGNPVNPQYIGKRIPVPFDMLKEWLIVRGKKGGFAIHDTVVQSGYIYIYKQDDKPESKRLLSVRFDGMLTVTDPDQFRKTIVAGIGSGKAFGFGLLSIAPVK